jgi:flagellar basal body-associated protein FliL
MNKPGAADSGDGMSRQMKIALISLPAVAVVVGVIFIWSFEKSRQEARRQEAQVAAQKIFDEAQQALGQNNIPEAVQKLKTYLSDENATQISEAKKLLAEIELGTSPQLASSTLDALGEEDFQRFQQSRHYSDARIAHPTLIKLWDSTLASALPTAMKKREEAEAKRLAELKRQEADKAAELEKSKKEQSEREAERKAAAAKKAMEAQTPTERFEKFVAKVRDELPKDSYFREHVSRVEGHVLTEEEALGFKFSYDVRKTDSLVSPLVATIRIVWRARMTTFVLNAMNPHLMPIVWAKDYVLVCSYTFQDGRWVFGNCTARLEGAETSPTEHSSQNKPRIEASQTKYRLEQWQRSNPPGSDILRSSDQF